MIRFTNHILLSVQLNSQSQLKIDSENCSLRNGYNTTSKYKSQQKSLQFYTSLIYLQSLELFLQPWVPAGHAVVAHFRLSLC